MDQKSLIFVVLAAILASPVSTKAQTEAVKCKDRPHIGRVENVSLPEADLVLKARIDTGAGLASINARDISTHKKNDGKHEVAEFTLTDGAGHEKRLERPIVKWINIKKKGGEGYIKRPVVKLDFCMGGQRIEARVNLANRENYLYPLLIGRNVLKTGDYLIDPEQKFILDPTCK